MKKQGTIVRWDTARGFGFIRSASASGDVFLHVRDCRGFTPQEGLAVSFEEIHVGGKGPRATAVQAAGAAANHAPRTETAGPSRRNAAPRTDRRSPRRSAAPSSAAPATPALLLMLAWSALIAWGIWIGRLPLLAVGAALLLNLVTFFAYWLDKHAAQKGQWRTPENTLHLFSLLGGWPGAWFAQQLLRHKSSKASFRAAYWGTVLLHGLLLAGWVFPSLLRKLLPNI